MFAWFLYISLTLKIEKTSLNIETLYRVPVSGEEVLTRRKLGGNVAISERSSGVKEFKPGRFCAAAECVVYCLATCTRKPRVPSSNPITRYVQKSTFCIIAWLMS